jgi:hypothetical protein
MSLLQEPILALNYHSQLTMKSLKSLAHNSALGIKSLANALD